jgi:alpha-beta hydrolase superfamily lysophospholipase
MQIAECHWKTADALEIYAKHWQVENPKAVVCLLHGLGEHVNRYNHVAAFFAERGIATHGSDRRGHGQSAGKRGHAPHLDALLNEVGQLVDFAGKTYPRVPLFLYGHSMGGNHALNFLLRKKPALRGVIATGSWIRLPQAPSAALIAFAKIMNKIAPTFAQSNGLDTNLLSKDPAVVKAYVADPLVHDRITVAMGLSMMEAAAWLDRFSGEIPAPLLLMHGADDRITDPQGSAGFAQRVSGDVTCRLWEGLYHEIHHEPQQAQVLAFMVEWMMKKC